MAFSLSADGFYFGTPSEPISRYTADTRPQYGGQPVEWWFTTEDSLATVSAANYFNAVATLVRGGDLIRVVVVSNRGASNQSVTDSSLYSVDSVTAGVVSVTERAEAGAGGGTWGSITGTLSNQTDLQSAIDAKAASSHTHTGAQVTISGGTEGNAVSIDASGNLVDSGTTPGGEGGGGTWGTITGTLSNQTDLQAAIDAKAASSHTHAISDVTNLQTTLDGKLDDLSGLASADANNGFSGAITFWTGTAAEYSGLTPDSQTVYFVTA